MARNVTIKGLAGLKGDLADLETNLAQGVQKAREAIAEALADDIATDAPVDTGRLRNTVQADGTDVVVGGSEAPYAEEVEDVNPYIRPNLDAMEKRGVQIAEDAIRKEIG